MCVLRPTTRDLAKAAGVSLATVDRVLNGRAGVHRKTVEAVNQAIESIGFVRNISAANLARGKSYRFIFVLPLSGDEFLQELLARTAEANASFASDMVTVAVRQIHENDPHEIANFLGSLDPAEVDGVAIMAPESPQVRDAMTRLSERGIRALPFISDQMFLDGADFVGIDNRAAGATAGRLLGRFLQREAGRIVVIAESMQSRDSLERRIGFDTVMRDSFPHLTVLPSLETYGDADRTARIIANSYANFPDIVGAYVLGSEARRPLEAVTAANPGLRQVIIAHERTPFTEQALIEGRIDAVIAQNPGHLVRSAIRILRARTDQREPLASQERIRIEILLKENL